MTENVWLQFEEDQEPDEGEMVLVTCELDKGEYTPQCIASYEEGFFYVYGIYRSPAILVTHWKRLDLPNTKYQWN